MTPSKLVIFEDGGGQWGPITDLRAVFDLRTGALTSKQRIECATGLPTSALWSARTTLHNLIAAQHQLPVNPAAFDAPVLAVNGRWPGARHADAVAKLTLGSALVQRDGQVIAAHLAAQDASTFLNPQGTLGELPAHIRRTTIDDTVLLERPWHILDGLETNLASDLKKIDLPQMNGDDRRVIRFGEHPVYVAEDAVVQPGAIFNSEQGPIVIESGALVGALSVLEGPCYVGRGTTIVCHAHIRPNTVIGPNCKAAGEISFSILHSYSNKAHHGYMGHCLVGQWVNLGAATNVSNLKNTYGTVRVQLECETAPQDTGRTFNGPIIGDMVRTGIGTRLLTGCCVGTGAMIAHSGYVPKYVPRMTFLTDRDACPYQPDKFIATVRNIMSRRHVQLDPALEERLRSMMQ